MSGRRPTAEYLMERRRLLDQAIEKRILEEERFGTNEDYENGTILIVKYKFELTTTEYTYVVIKVNAVWYTTSQYDGSEWKRVMSWDMLMGVLANATSVELVTQVEDI